MARNFTSAAEALRSAPSAVSAWPVTIAAWVRMNALGTSIKYFACYNNSGANRGTSDFALCLSTGNAVVANKNGLGSATTSTTISDTTAYHHVCGVWASDTDRRAYLDGGGKGTSATSQTIPTVDRMTIGGQDGLNGVASAALAIIAEFAVWNAVLTDAEIAVLAKGLCPLQMHPEALVDYVPLYGAVLPEPDRKSNARAPAVVTSIPAKAAHPRIFMPRRRVLV